MKILGIDIGGSATKIIMTDSEKLLSAHQFSTGRNLPDINILVSEFMNKYGYNAADTDRIALTGVGSSFINGDIMNIPTYKIDEFEAAGKGALTLTGIDNALIVNMGTGTSYVRLENGKAVHIGGSGAGGGTFAGLAGILTGENDLEKLTELAGKGDLSRVDLQIKDISDKEIPGLPMHATAANFGKVTNSADKNDYAAGIINLILQTIGMLAVFASKGSGIKDVVLTGAFTGIIRDRTVFKELGEMHGINFIVPENAAFSCAIGAVNIAVKK